MFSNLPNMRETISYKMEIFTRENIRQDWPCIRSDALQNRTTDKYPYTQELLKILTKKYTASKKNISHQIQFTETFKKILI